VPKRSAALLVYRLTPASPAGSAGLEVLIAHMGGPFFASKDAGAWSIPKGEYEPDEAPLDAARREFAEEMGSPAPGGEIAELGECRQPGGKIITTFAVSGSFDTSTFHSNTFSMEWPRGSGQLREFPEMDRAEWMSIDRAAQLLAPGQVPILDALRAQLGDWASE
jgi:predicted NUDIX family NTP pyrophosphohydrolase